MRKSIQLLPEEELRKTPPLQVNNILQSYHIKGATIMAAPLIQKDSLTKREV